MIILQTIFHHVTPIDLGLTNAIPSIIMQSTLILNDVGLFSLIIHSAYEIILSTWAVLLVVLLLCLGNSYNFATILLIARVTCMFNY